MASKMPPALMAKFKGKESKSEEKGEKKMSPAMYKKGEKKMSPAMYKKGEKMEEAKMKAKKK